MAVWYKLDLIPLPIDSSKTYIYIYIQNMLQKAKGVDTIVLLISC